MLATKKYGEDVYVYFKRHRNALTALYKINGKTWGEAAEELGLSIPGLFLLLEHALRAGLIREVRIR